MTTKNWKKTFQQLKAKPITLKKYIKHNAPKKRTSGAGQKRCKRCGRYGGHISKYHLDLCRCCFREVATSIGFKKYR
ncbi:30S ribosomal protein S14 [Candidatus Woesearchaeota archaeon]|nr:30S ribosomal protein S14 [Candidatus Woesearchaeota archaeon]